LYHYLHDHCATQPLTVLAGMTGTGKTALLNQLGHSVDLERAANHKGSSFGRPLDRQPSQTDFENRIALALLTVQQQHPGRTAVVEDESRTIGARHLPPYLVGRMASSDLVVVNVPFEERLERLWQEYVVERHANSLLFYGDDGEQQFADHLRHSVVRIKKRLGGLRTQQILTLVEQALAVQQRDNFASHRHWLAALTRDYYDPMYRYQLERKRDKITYSGSPSEVLAFLRSH
jgi:tRNA 2-selenouridine synthase